jgi:hypothetical protein
MNTYPHWTMAFIPSPSSTSSDLSTDIRIGPTHSGARTLYRAPASRWYHGTVRE